jgi:hypothetical protein
MWMSPKTSEMVSHIRKTIAERIPPELVVPQHDEYGHKYRHVPTNQVFSSVTTKTAILDNERLKRWSARIAVEYIDRNWQIINSSKTEEKERHFKAAVLAHEDELKDAGDIGTQGHGVIERYLNRWIEKGEQPDDIRRFIIGQDARLWAIARSAEKFCKDFDVIPVVSELRVCSIKHKFAGTLDSLMLVKKGDKYIFAIVDWKTSNSVDKPEYAMQVSAYWQAFYEMTGLRPSELIIVQLDKDKMKYNCVRVIDRPKSFRAFKYVCQIYDYINDGMSKLYPFTPKREVFIT